ncbi:MAG TPA: methyltransferase domain-containing protein [Vicinamibacterales bacterium]|jgi:SAM-dependent methyltransferase|nr:methyltransferase domain-containing protein [Vicinamibacterales bacterium]
MAKRRANEGAAGWNEYAPFYDWENARTVQRRDVPFWQSIALAAGGDVLELGTGTGRIAIPVARAGADVTGIDLSEPMLRRARTRLRRSRAAKRPRLVRGDVRFLPFRPDSFALVMAPYGILQSLVRERDLRAALDAAARVLPPNGRFVMDLVPDLPRWSEYSRRKSLSGRFGASSHVTLIESVSQDRRKGLTRFDQEYIVRRGRRTETHRFSLTFRTVSVAGMRRRLERAGFRVDAVLGDYDGGPWDPRADVWVVIASRT